MTKHIRIILMLCIAFLAIQHATAQSAELFGGFTVGNMKPEKDIEGLQMKGWNTSITMYPTYRFGLTADFAGYYGTYTATGSSGNTTTQSQYDLRQYSFMAGPQIRLIHKKAFDTSFRALFGGGRAYLPASNGTLDEANFAALFGTNIDLNVSKHVALRFSPGLYITQFGNETQKNFRFSIGPVFRFGDREN